MHCTVLNIIMIEAKQSRRQKKTKTFWVAGFFFEKNFPDDKCAFLGVHAEQKHRK